MNYKIFNSDVGEIHLYENLFSLGFFYIWKHDDKRMDQYIFKSFEEQEMLDFLKSVNAVWKGTGHEGP